MTISKRTEELKEIRGCIVKHFAFYYDNWYPVHKKTKYGTSYWPQKPESEKLKKMEEEDRLWELDKDSTATFSPESAKMLIIQKYDKATSNTKNKQTSKKYKKRPDQKDLKGIKNPFSQQSNNNLYNFNPKKETFSNTKDT